MGKARDVVIGGVLGAAIGVVVAPRHGESRREALGRLRQAARPGRGALRAFAGTPCAAAGRTHGPEPDGGRPRDAYAGPAAKARGDDDG